MHRRQLCRKQAGHACDHRDAEEHTDRKVLATKGYGADVVLAGDNYDECYQEALRLQEEKGATFIHPFDDEDVIAGQGTIAYEICHDLPMWI